MKPILSSLLFERILPNDKDCLSLGVTGEDITSQKASAGLHICTLSPTK
jgi:hypothetical protein